MQHDLDAIAKAYDLRQEVSRVLGKPLSTGKSWGFVCPFHHEKTPGAFHVWADGFRCFSCGRRGDLFDWYAFATGKPLADVIKEFCDEHAAPNLDRVQIAARQAERVEQDLEAAIKRAECALGELREAKAWERYHENLTTWARDEWQRRGVPEWYQDYACFGFDPDHVIYWQGAEYHTPTLTIPILEPVTRDCLNVKHRLLNPPDNSPGNKYRPERTGLGAHLFVAFPDKPVAGKVLAVEGEVKGAVAGVTLDAPDWQVVGLPGKEPSPEVLAELHEAEQVVLCLDPDAQDKVPKVAAQLGLERVRNLELPGKIDDMINAYRLDAAWLRSTLRSARRVMVTA